MGGWLGIGGSSAKTDRKTELAGYGDLSNIFNFGMNTAGQEQKTGQDITNAGLKTTGTGLADLSTSGDYWKKLLSGNRADVAQAVAPETNAVNTSADASRTAAARSGTARTGGTASADQQAHEATMAKIDSMLFGVRPTAAGQVADIGKSEAGIGLGEAGVGQSELNNALGFGNLAVRSASDLTSNARESRMDSYKINKQTQQDWTKFIQGIASGFMG
jgi:hypothetical protein